MRLMNWRINNMKTVMDAVNEFKGEWKGVKNHIYVGSRYNGQNKGVFQFTYDSIGNDQWEPVSTRAEFNDLVSQLETNFGECKESYRGYKTQFEYMTNKSTKELELMDEESNQCKISNLGNVLHNMSCSMDDEDEQNEFGGYASFCWDLADELRKSECAADTTKPSEPVFTQAMADNGELPPIGAKVQFVGNDDYLVEFNINDGDEIECICHTKDFEGDSIGVYRHKDGFSVSILNQLIEPIDTRTDKEKAFDEHFEKSGCDYKYQSILRNAFDAGVKWVGE